MPMSRHVNIGGSSDGGKTTLLREMHETFDGVSIWVNHESGVDDGYTEGVAGHRASGLKAIHTGIGKFEEWEEVRINLKVKTAWQGVEIARDAALDIYDTTASHGAPVPVQIIVDECHHAYSNENVDGQLSAKNCPIMWLAAEGRDMLIKLVQATQHTGKLPVEEALNFKWYVWCGEYPELAKGWLSYYNINRDDVADEPWHYTCFDRGMGVVCEGETMEKYA